MQFPTNINSDEMVKYTIITLLFFLLNSSLFCQVSNQAYYHNCLIARQKYAMQEFDSSAYFYQKAFEFNCYHNSTDLYEAAKLNTKINRDSIAIVYLIEAYKNGLNKSLKLKDNNYWKTIKDSIDNYCSIALNRVIIGYDDLIDSLSNEDQRVRGRKYRNAMDVFMRYYFDSTLNKLDKEYIRASQLVFEWRKVDSLNFYKLRDYINSYGFPFEGNVENVEVTHKAIVILLHFDYDTTAQTTFEIIDSALIKGLISPKDYALIVDRRMCFSLGKPPHFYQLPLGISSLNEDYLKLINKRRNDIGLDGVFDGRKIKIRKNSIKIKG